MVYWFAFACIQIYGASTVDMCFLCSSNNGLS